MKNRLPIASRLAVIKMCNGSTRRNADTLASLINFNVSQNDSVLLVDRAIPINTTDKFRNQSVEVIIYVPVGHHIKVNKNLGYSNNIRVNGLWNHDEWYNWDEDDLYFKYGQEYVMREDGLYTLNGIPAAKEDNWHSDDENDDDSGRSRSGDQNYRYEPDGKKLIHLERCKRKANTKNAKVCGFIKGCERERN